VITKLKNILEIPISDGSILHGRYKIHHFIGKGSYGLAYRALDFASNKLVVVKQLRRKKQKARKGLLEREARMLQALDQPAFPKMIDLFEEEGKSFLVMDYLKGRNVEELIFYDARIYNEKESFLLLLSVLKVVKHIHEKEMIHRDLRLPNILMNGNEVYVIDFGLAVFSNERDPNFHDVMPLEKRLYREISYTSDFYALGHFLLFLLYSSYEENSKKKQSWEEELNLTKEAQHIIRKLLKLDSVYEHIDEIIEDVTRYISKI
jgi:serine/threonine protein kinase, bacterial